MSSEDVAGPGGPSSAAVLDALKTVVDPELRKDVVALGQVKQLVVDGGQVAFTLELATPAHPARDRIRDGRRTGGGRSARSRAVWRSRWPPTCAP